MIFVICRIVITKSTQGSFVKRMDQVGPQILTLNNLIYR